MRRVIVLFVGMLCAILTAAVGQVPVSGALPSDSIHRIWDDATSEVACTTCHMDPDEARAIPISSDGSRPLLWNPDIQAATNTGYDSPTMDARPAMLSGSSALCMSCHDGTLAEMSSGLAIGRDGLSNDHPISFRYDASLAARDGKLRDPSYAPSGLGGTIGQDLLESGTMQCTSCHVFHERSSAVPMLLRKSNTRSNLCLTCHNF